MIYAKYRTWSETLVYVLGELGKGGIWLHIAYFAPMSKSKIAEFLFMLTALYFVILSVRAFLV